MATNKSVNFISEREGDDLNLVVKMDSIFRRKYQNMSISAKRDFDQQIKSYSESLQKMLDQSIAEINEASREQVINSGKVRILNYKK
jgi:hypothetical protein